MTLIIQIAQANTKMLKWRIPRVIQRLGLLPEKQISAGFRQCLAGFLESDLLMEAHRHLHSLKPEKKDLNHTVESFAVWSKRSSIESDDRSCCSSRRCEVELELSHSFTPATIKCALLTAFLKRSNREDLKISLVRVFSTQSSYQTGERCASRDRDSDRKCICRYL